jgi:2-polyprenyl-3-methyl-5-hydroxy-6-metoxy-1,4-benzoquinol methylase
MPILDPWGSTDALSAAELDPMAARLEQRGQQPRFAAMLDDYLGAMDIDRAASVLDMGCGTGVVARTIAKRPGFRGRIVGVDLSPDFIIRAGALAREEGVGDHVSFEAGDTAALGLADSSFDAIVAHTLLSHVEDPVGILREARRLLAPTGTMAVFDVDWAALTHDAADGSISDILDGKPVGMFFAQPRAMRQLPRWAREAALKVETVRGYVFCEVGRADYSMAGIVGLSGQLATTGYVSEAKAAAWLAALAQASEAGEYFGASNLYAYFLRPQ